MTLGQKWDFQTGENEFALVVLGGSCQVTSNKGNWTDVGRRPNVFAGMPYTLYLPAETRFTLEATSKHLDIAYGWSIAHDMHPARLVKPDEVEIEIRGGGNVTRQINKMIPPGFPDFLSRRRFVQVLGAGLLIAKAKMANLRAMRGERDSALIYYRGSEELAREAVATLPNNTASVSGPENPKFDSVGVPFLQASMNSR